MLKGKILSSSGSRQSIGMTTLLENQNFLSVYMVNWLHLHLSLFIRIFNFNLLRNGDTSCNFKHHFRLRHTELWANLRKKIKGGFHPPLLFFGMINSPARLLADDEDLMPFIINH